MSKPIPKPREPEAPAPAQVMPDEAITLIRASSAVDVRALPDVPAGFRGAPNSMRLQLIERVAENDRAELVRAADELDERRDSVAADLGRLAPDANALAALRERVVSTGDAVTRLEALTVAAKQQHEVALSDLSRMVRRAAERVRFDSVDDPEVARRYPLSLAYASRRSETIAEGMERHRRQREAATAAAKATPPAASDKPAEQTEGDKPKA